MKQLIQNLKTGQTSLEEIPAPLVKRGGVLIRTTHSLVSLGTEKMLVEFGKANLIDKARQQPDKVKMVLDKIRTEGLFPTLEAVFNKLDQPLPLGYCNAGVVVEVGEGVRGLAVGDRVVSNGPHAEFVSVPQHLVAKIPDNVAQEEAVFTVIASIGLQGIRLANPTLGETVVVYGLGLIGLLTVQLLRANGCRVIGIDIDDNKLRIAEQFGAIAVNGKQADVVRFVEDHTNGIGADAVLITASAKNNDIISGAARMSRKRGRIILIGVIGLELSRAEFYEKELSFQVSCSYGPGRYDESYEQKGHDYPLPFVRWTEQRNFEAILQAMSLKDLQVLPLITERVAFESFGDIYSNMGASGSIASILVYEGEKALERTVVLQQQVVPASGGIAIVGAGNFTRMTMMPALKKIKAPVVAIASANGISGTALAKKYAIGKSTTDYREVLVDNSVGLVMITTRHHVHAAQVIESLKAGKHVFVEKPLAITEEQLDDIVTQYQQSPNRLLHVGFNRRFSPHSLAVKKALGRGPMNIVATMNAGFIPANSWVQDMNSGGGRIIGEACHFIDLCAYFTDSEVTSVCMNAMGTSPESNTDNASLMLRFADGSHAVVNYFSNGSKAYAKERVEVYTQGRTAIIDNWRKTTGYGFSNLGKIKTSIDKGHHKQFELLLNKMQTGGDNLISFSSLVNTTRASIRAVRSLQEGRWIDL